MPEGDDDLLARCIDLCLAGKGGDADALLEGGGAEAEGVRRQLAAYRRTATVLRRAVRGVSQDSFTPGIPADEYEPLALLGQGAVGRVYLARQRSLGRVVALKTLGPDAALPAGALERFGGEGKILARLDHPHIVSVYAVGVHPEGGAWISMRYVRGIPLSEVISFMRGKGGLRAGDVYAHIAARVRRFEDSAGLSPSAPAEPLFPPAEPAWRLGVWIAARVARALHAAHERRLVHRDVKPSNILIGPDGAPVIVDFGLTLEDDRPRLTVAGELLGTPLYMAPECMREGASKADARSDVYSLGVTLYEFLAGKTPFGGRGLAAIVHEVEKGAPPALRGVSPALQGVVFRCLAKDPGSRPPSAEALARDLDAVLRGEALVSAGRGRWRVWAGGGLAAGLFLAIFRGSWTRAPATAPVSPVLATPAAPPPSPSAAVAAPAQPRSRVKKNEAASLSLPTPVPAAVLPPPIPSAVLPPPAMGETFFEEDPLAEEYVDPERIYALRPPSFWTKVEDGAGRVCLFRSPDARASLVARVYARQEGSSLDDVLRHILEGIPGRVKVVAKGERQVAGRTVPWREVLTRIGKVTHRNRLFLVDNGATVVLVNGFSREEGYAEFDALFEKVVSSFRLL